MDGGGLDDNTVVFDELLDMCARVGIPDLSLLTRVDPNFALADAGDDGAEDGGYGEEAVLVEGGGDVGY